MSPQTTALLALCVAAVALLEIVALSNGVNGVGLAAAVGVIGAVTGYVYKMNRG